ncbi:MAG: hydroxyacyl-ACP dehydratase HTD2-like protein with hotdog domain [Gammaproteobacteria bacterium]|jgi:hydroxyacyl-ACP dehydratase HTD2-like protein with hotdog domain
MTRITNIQIGEVLPEREINHDIVQSFMYNAAIWNAHRIHFDAPYTTEVEGYPGLVIAGPLMGDWLTQCAIEWLADDGLLLTFEYSNRKAAFIGEVLRIGGVVVSTNIDEGEVALDLYVKNEADEIITPGKAVVRLTN